MTADVPPLYRRLLGPTFDTLAPQVQALHDVRTAVIWRGEAEVMRGRSVVARIAGWATGLPQAGTRVPLTLRVTPRDGGESWQRSFGSDTFATSQFPRGDVLCERAGPVTFHFRLAVQGGTLSFALQQVRVLGVPLPRILATQVSTREWDEDGRYRFDARADLPFFGLLVHYRGWLLPASAPDAPSR